MLMLPLNLLLINFIMFHLINNKQTSTCTFPLLINISTSSYPVITLIQLELYNNYVELNTVFTVLIIAV